MEEVKAPAAATDAAAAPTFSTVAPPITPV
jgi:hypothetical protein